VPPRGLLPPQVQRTRRRRRRRRRSHKWLRDTPKRGVITAASIALGAVGLRDYGVPDWYSGFYGVPGSLLRRKITSHTNEMARAKTLLVRLNYLIDQHLGNVGKTRIENGSRRPITVLRKVWIPSYPGAWIAPKCHEFHGWQTLGSVKSYLSKTLEEFVNLPLSRIRSRCSVQGPRCAEPRCGHVSCCPLYWSSGKTALTSWSAGLSPVAAKLLIVKTMRR